MAVRAGRHVLVEKPFTDTLQSTTELLALADSRAVLACPVHQFLFQPPLLDLHRTLEEIGPVVHLRTLACSAGADRLPSSRWDEIALDILPHHLAIVTRFLDATVSATEWQVGHPAAGELRVMTVAGGASVELTVSMRGRPPRNELTIVGAHGSIHVDLFHGFATVERGAATRFQKIARPFLSGAALVAGAAGTLARRTARWEPAYPGLRELVARMHSAARDGSTPPITPAEVLAVARLRELVAARL